MNGSNAELPADDGLKARLASNLTRQCSGASTPRAADGILCLTDQKTGAQRAAASALPFAEP